MEMKREGTAAQMLREVRRMVFNFSFPLHLCV
jgi:hypothetical protein